MKMHIPPMMSVIEIDVRGLSSLLSHNPAAMERSTARAKPGSSLPTPQEEAERGAYRTEDGSFAIPTISFRTAMVTASGAWKATKGRGSMKGTVGHVMHGPEDLAVLVDPDTGSPLTEYTVSTMRAVVQRQGVLRSRPMYPKWGAQFWFGYEPNLVTPEVLIKILGDAGVRMGVGDYRPQRTGWFGMFEVTGHKTIREAE